MSQIANQVEAIVDPFLEMDVRSMGIESSFADGTLTLTAGFPVLPLQKSLLPALKAQLPENIATIRLDSDIRPHRTQMPGQALRNVKNTIAIASGKGGVGKSTVAVNLAVALARAGARVGLLDVDIYGPSVPLMLGAHQPVELQDDRYLPIQAHGISAMSIGYLANGQEPLVWRGPMLAKAFIQMLDITLWDNLDYLLIDLPPGTGDIQLSLVQKIPLAGAVVVTTPQPVATLDARKAIRMFETTRIEVLGIVENMSLHTCSHCGHTDALFGEGGGAKLAAEFSLPLLGQLPLDPEIRAKSDEGEPFSNQQDIFMKTALSVAVRLAKQPRVYGGNMPPVRAG